VIAVAVMLMPVLVFVLVLLVVVFVLALLVLMFVGAKGTAENVGDSHFVLPSFFTWELFPAAARRTTSQFDVSLGTFCHDPQGGGGHVTYSRNVGDLSSPTSVHDQCMLASPVPPTARS
jgi:hypothetical protein